MREQSDCIHKLEGTERFGMPDIQDAATEEKLKEMGDTWSIQDEQIESLDPLKYSSWPWIILKGVFGVIILTTIYLIYNLVEIPWTIGENFYGMWVFAGVPFFVAFVLGMTFESGVKALAFALTVGMISLALLVILLHLPYNMGLFDSSGGGQSTYLWWYILLSFINLISLVPVGAVLASSTNVFE